MSSYGDLARGVKSVTWPYSVRPRPTGGRLFSNAADSAQAAALAGLALRQCVMPHYAGLRALSWRALHCAPPARPLSKLSRLAAACIMVFHLSLPSMMMPAASPGV